jgi:pimeloyl-ACP methyl ester carboxylesterase
MVQRLAARCSCNGRLPQRFAIRIRSCWYMAVVGKGSTISVRPTVGPVGPPSWWNRDGSCTWSTAPDMAARPTFPTRSDQWALHFRSPSSRASSCPPRRVRLPFRSARCTPNGRATATTRPILHLLQFLASSGPFAADAADRRLLEQRRLVQLLERIGPSFVVSNSLGGPAGFLVADARPDLVVGLAQLEPVGPAFSPMFGPDTLQWGVAAIAMHFDPPVMSPAELDLVAGQPPAPGLPAPMMQREPKHRLVNLAQVPIAVLSSEASVFRLTNPPLVAFLQQAGCDAQHIDLAEHGVRGNGHGAMFERNNADVLAVVTQWMLAQLR